jgi:hypothetical protein
VKSRARPLAFRAVESSTDSSQEISTLLEGSEEIKSLPYLRMLCQGLILPSREEEMRAKWKSSREELPSAVGEVSLIEVESSGVLRRAGVRIVEEGMITRTSQERKEDKIFSPKKIVIRAAMAMKEMYLTIASVSVALLPAEPGAGTDGARAHNIFANFLRVKSPQVPYLKGTRN